MSGEVEPVLATMVVDVDDSAAEGGNCYVYTGGHYGGAWAKALGPSILLAAVVAASIVIIYLLVRRARGCSKGWLCAGPKSGKEGLCSDKTSWEVGLH